MCLLAAFAHTYPESAKKLLEFIVFFALLGYVRIKAARKMLVIIVDQIDATHKKVFFLSLQRELKINGSFVSETPNG